MKINVEKLKKTKIIATIGPSCEDKTMLLKLIKAGTNVFRINFSHATHEGAKETIQLIRELNKEHGYNVAILADLQGPKLRIGKVEEGAFLSKDDILTFSNEKTKGTAKKVYMTYTHFAADVNVGESILIDDGKISLKVIETNKKDKVKAKVIHGGALLSKKGVNLPNTLISLPALTEKDIVDAAFALEQDVDWIALSFVRNAEDIKSLRKLIKSHRNNQIKIIAKIEKPEALVNIDSIIEQTDALMVARGDLGVEIPMEEVPLIQKKLVEKAKKAMKPVIIATQMMETMINSMTPTRAEVNDVANSVLDGADALMLSGETSVGDFPVEVIKKMQKIILNVEDHNHTPIPPNMPVEKDDRFVTDTICYNAVMMANHVKAKAIVALTYSGYTGFVMSSHRPLSPILIFTPNRKLLSQMSLLWGVTVYYFESNESTDETVVQVNLLAKKYKFVRKGDRIINLNAMPLNENGKTNTLRLSTMDK